MKIVSKVASVFAQTLFLFVLFACSADENKIGTISSEKHEVANLFSASEVYTVKVELAEADWSDLLTNATKEQYYRATLNFNGSIVEDVGFRAKGQSSLRNVARVLPNGRSYGRFSFKLDFNRYKKQKFMSMKHLMLNSGYGDPSLMRDLVAYNVMKSVGMPAPELSFVDLWVAGKHMGLYQLVEVIDSEFIEKYFPDDKLDKGDLYKPGTGSTLYVAEVQSVNLAEFAKTKPGESFSKLKLKTNEETLETERAHAALYAFLKSSNTGSAQHIDVENMLRYLAASSLLSNLDSYFTQWAQNFYLYEHRAAGGFTLLPWDYNHALGGFRFEFGCDATEFLLDHPTAVPIEQRPIIARVLEREDYRERYHLYVRQLTEGIFNPERMRAFLERYRALIAPYVEKDPTSFYSFDEWQRSLYEEIPDDQTFMGTPLGLMTFIEQRYQHVRRQLDGEIASGNGGRNACAD